MRTYRLELEAIFWLARAMWICEFDGTALSDYWSEAFRENPLGQNDNCTDELTFD